MLGFKRKGLLWKEENKLLYTRVEVLKEQLDYKRKLLENGVDVSDEMRFEVIRVEALYSLLLREARIRYSRKKKK